MGAITPPAEAAWTPAKVVELARLSAEGYSAGLIADILGVTRSAVLHRQNRAGIQRPTRRELAHHRTTSIWTPERVAELVKLTAEGYSGGMIAQMFGITRNAVIGRQTRMKIRTSQQYEDGKSLVRRYGRHRSPWTEEMNADLKRMSEEGCRAADIAEHLGVTKGAVTNKQKRMGLRHVSSQRKSYITGRPRHYQPSLFSILPDSNIPDALRIGLMDIHDEQCRALLDEKGDDGLALYCGHPTFGGKSYCAGHCRIFYQAPVQKDSAPFLQAAE